MSYCPCGKGFDLMRFMLQCSSCHIWYHGECISMSEEKSSTFLTYACPTCTLSGKASLLKNINITSKGSLQTPLPARFDSLSLVEIENLTQSSKRNNFHEKNIYSNKNTDAFRNVLFHNMFATSGIRSLKATELTEKDLMQFGLQEPILMIDSSALKMTVPNRTLSLQDLEKIIGCRQEIYVTTTSSQVTQLLTLTEWSRMKLSFKEPLNLRFRIQGSHFEHRIHGPAILTEIDWHYQFLRASSEGHPTTSDDNLYGGYGAAHTYLDFSIHAGGASAWIFLLNGSIDYFLIPPTAENLTKFEQFVLSDKKKDLFFGNLVSKCIKVRVQAGNTFIIPSGWIVASLSITTSLFFTGLFQHSLNLKGLLDAYQLECRVTSALTQWAFTPPTLDSLWRQVEYTVNRLRPSPKPDSSAKAGLTNAFENEGLHTLLRVLKSWTVAPQKRTVSDQPKTNSHHPHAAVAPLHDHHQVPIFVQNPLSALRSLQTVLNKSKSHIIPKKHIIRMKKMKNNISSSACRCHTKKCTSCRNCLRRHCTCFSKKTYEAPSTAEVTATAAITASVGTGEVHVDSSLITLPLLTDPFQNETDPMSGVSTPINVSPELLLPPLNWTSNEGVETVWSDHQSSFTGKLTLSGYDDLGLEIGAMVFTDAFDMSMPMDNVDDGVSDDEEDGLMHDDTIPPHRTTCHCCSNLRKKTIQCTTCPQIFCTKCFDKMIEEYGPTIFENGCPVCKDQCCCGSTRSENCSRRYHCYKKCLRVKPRKSSSLCKKSNNLTSDVNHVRRTIFQKERIGAQLPPSFEEMMTDSSLFDGGVFANTTVSYSDLEHGIDFNDF